GKLPSALPQLPTHEQDDFQNAHQSLEEYVRLRASLKKQEFAHTILRSWRYVHMVLVPLALLIITYHAVAELLINVLHVIKV
ncbi:MAG TPA: hypothetical protein VGN15_13915, partial [Ktedonobacteraceae bacterium]|nr:hypothetical protein [Ktedonobacteraceae bacterium]